MKNVFRMLLVAMVAILAIACEKNPVEDGRLATPKFNCTVTDNEILVSWEAVSGAAYYEIALNGYEAERTDKLVHRFEELQYDTEYTIKLQAIAADSSKSSEIGTKKVTIGKRAVPAYREWYPQNNASAQAISNNGRWVVGGYDRQGMIIDLTTDEVTLVDNFELMDVADNGVAVGSYYGDSQDGEAAIFINGAASKIDLSELTTSKMSALSGITPDGEYVVGWWWEYDEKSYYGSKYGMSVPFCYDVIKDRITIPEVGDTPYAIGAISTHGVSPDRRILGCEQSGVAMSIMWEDEYSSYSHLYFDYDGNYNPISTFGDLSSRFSAGGNYVCGIAKSYENGEAQQPAVYDCTTGEVITMTGLGSATCVTDDGIAFLNDALFYIGTTSYVVDLKGDIEKQTPIIDWLLDEHKIDLYNYIQEGVITIGASENGRVLVGITNTNSGWLTYVIDLDGEAMPEI
jgi:hypothetical protein